MSLSKYLLNISEYHKSIGILKKTNRQIQKDLGIDESEFVFSGDLDVAYEELIHHTENLLDLIIKTRGELLYSLLYRADVCEKSMVDIIDDELDVNKRLSKLLVERELVKVLTREYYKSNSKG